MRDQRWNSAGEPIGDDSCELQRDDEVFEDGSRKAYTK
ncbi:Uncharacterised protein [Mycobacterium tuberculosis]|nr:Uncharacterised protein [Mycobacterium tuberculosis]